MLESRAGVAVAQVMKAHVAQVGFLADSPPRLVEAVMAEGAVRPRRREHPNYRSRHAVQDRAGGGRQPDRSRPGLAVGQEQLALAPVAPLQRANLAGATPGQQQQPDNGDLLRTVGLEADEYRRQAAYLRRRQEPFAPLAPVSLDARARIGSLRPVAVDLGLAHDDREHGNRAVRRHRGIVERREPEADIVGSDVADRASPEPGQNLLVVIAPVDLEGRGFPVAGVAPKDLVGDRLERDVRWRRGLFVTSFPDRGQQALGPSAGLVRTDGAGFTDDLPDPPAAVLAMDEVALGARGQYPDAEAPELAVADVVSGLAPLEGPDAGVGEGDPGHVHPPAFCCSRGENADRFRVPRPDQEERSNAVSVR